MSDYRIVIERECRYLAEDRHGPTRCFWADMRDPFMLRFDIDTEGAAAAIQAAQEYGGVPVLRDMDRKIIRGQGGDDDAG